MFFVVVISSIRNLCCICCDSAIMPGEGGGVEAKREGETEVISVLKLLVCYC